MTHVASIVPGWYLFIVLDVLRQQQVLERQNNGDVTDTEYKVSFCKMLRQQITEGGARELLQGVANPRMTRLIWTITRYLVIVCLQNCPLAG